VQHAFFLSTIGAATGVKGLRLSIRGRLSGMQPRGKRKLPNRSGWSIPSDASDWFAEGSSTHGAHQCSPGASPFRQFSSVALISALHQTSSAALMMPL